MATKEGATGAALFEDKAILILIQVGLTAALGFFFSHQLAVAEKRLTDDSHRLETRLALSADYYRQRFTVYNDLLVTLGDLEAAMQEASVGTSTATRKRLYDSIVSLRQQRERNPLYLSPTLTDRLRETAAVALRATKTAERLHRAPSEELRRESRRHLEDIAVLDQKIKEQMTVDLDVPGLSTLAGR